MYYPDKKYKDYLEEMQNLLENKEAFVERYRTNKRTVRRIRTCC